MLPECGQSYIAYETHRLFENCSIWCWPYLFHSIIVFIRSNVPCFWSFNVWNFNMVNLKFLLFVEKGKKPIASNWSNGQFYYQNSILKRFITGYVRKQWFPRSWCSIIHLEFAFNHCTEWIIAIGKTHVRLHLDMLWTMEIDSLNFTYLSISCEFTHHTRMTIHLYVHTSFNWRHMLGKYSFQL